MRQGCSSKLVDNPISVQVCFNWRAPFATPACWLRISPNEERVSCGGDRGGGVTFPSSSSSEDLGSEGASSLVLSPPSEWLSKPVPFVFCAHDSSLWAWFASHLVASSCKVTPPPLHAPSIREILQPDTSAMSKSNCTNCRRRM
jgi:hypothetical protein